MACCSVSCRTTLFPSSSSATNRHPYFSLELFFMPRAPLDFMAIEVRSLIVPASHSPIARSIVVIRVALAEEESSDTPMHV